MKRIIVLTAVLGVAVAACASDSEPAATTSPSTTVATTTTTSPPQTVATTTTTIATTTTTKAAAAPAGIVPGEDADVDAVVEAYNIVFSSETTFEEKAPYLIEPDGLEETVAKYAETGTQMGGVSVAATAVEIDGDKASVSYALLFSGNPTYTDLSGTAVRTDAGWQVSRTMFCGLMQSARVGCPNE